MTLVRYTSGLSTAGAVLFFTDPKRHLMSFLALPPSTRIGSRSLARLDVPTTIAALRASTAVRVDHVALIDRSDVGSLVSGLGGITITNPDVVRTTEPSGRVRTFSAGRIRLDGPGAVAYLAG
ncbi:MAG TPA: LCP family protein, partial [Gaiellales bacterium]|nr:LCP family protein [Gaiellales bacterium]